MVPSNPGELPFAPTETPEHPGELLDALLAGTDAKAALDPNGLLDSLKKALAERALNAEMDHHLGGGRDGKAAMAMARRRFSPTAAEWKSQFRGTGSPALIRS